MNFLRFRVITLSLASFLATAAYAVEQLPEKEEDIPVEYIATYDNTVSVGLRHTSGKAKVKFGNLGVGNNYTIGSNGVLYYSNGTISADSPSSYEYNDKSELVTTAGQFNNYNSLNSNSTVNSISVRGAPNAAGQSVVTVYSSLYDYTDTPTTGTDGTVVHSYAYKVDSNGATLYQKDSAGQDRKASTYQFLAYKDGQTRSWSVANASQIHTDTGTVEMTTYAATSAGGTAAAEGGSSSGFEITLERRLHRFGKLEIGVAGGLSLADIKMRTTSVVLANKLETTDIYTMVKTGLNDDFFTTNNSAGITAQPSGAAKALYLLDLKDGSQMYDFYDASTLLTYYGATDLSGVTPLSLSSGYTAGTQKNSGMVLVQGTWQIKGAYYNARVGPTFRYRFNDRWAVSGGFGMSMCYVGTVFKADEEIFDIGSDTSVDASLFHPVEENSTHKFVPGYYGNLNVELWATERTGFYAGINYEKLGNYSQKPLSGRTAKIDLGTSVGWRIGIMTRF